MAPPTNREAKLNNPHDYSRQFLQNQTMHINNPEELFGFPNIQMVVIQYPESYERTKLIEPGEHSMNDRQDS